MGNNTEQVEQAADVATDAAADMASDATEPQTLADAMQAEVFGGNDDAAQSGDTSEPTEAEEATPAAEPEAGAPAVTPEQADGQAAGDAERDDTDTGAAETAGDTGGDEKTSDAAADETTEDDAAFLASLGERGQARFKKLNDDLREARELADAGSNLRSLINEHVADPQDLQQMLEVSRLMKVGDAQGALRLIDTARQRIALQAGVTDSAPDVLTGHDDLLQKVEAFELSREDAVLIARARHQDQQAQEQQQHQQQTAQQAAQEQQHRQQVQRGIATQVADWKATDPDFQAKFEQLVERIPAIEANYHPSNWLAAIKDTYQMIAAQAAKPAPAPAPLRPTATANKPKAEPKSLAEAMAQEMGWVSD